MRKKAPSLPLRSAVNYIETCAVTPSSQWILIKPSGHLFVAEQEVPVFVRVCRTKLWLCTEDSIFMTLLLILYVLCRYPPPLFFSIYIHYVKYLFGSSLRNSGCRAGMPYANQDKWKSGVSYRWWNAAEYIYSPCLRLGFFFFFLYFAGIFHFLLLYTFAQLHSGGKSCTFPPLHVSDNFSY